MEKHMKLLGLRVKDKVTNFEGICTTISFDLYGCVQAVVTPQQVKNAATAQDGRWFDVNRLTVIGKKPVMELPEFAQDKGPAIKPPFQEGCRR